MLKLLVAASAVAVVSAEYSDKDLAELQGSSFKVDSADGNIGDQGMIGVTGSPDQKAAHALFGMMSTLDKFDAKSAAAGYKTSTAKKLIPELADELSEYFAKDVSFYSTSTDNPLQQFIVWGGKMDYSSDEMHGDSEVAKSMATNFLDLSGNPVMTNVGPNQVSNIDYGEAAGVKYLVATVENFKPLALRDLYVDFTLSLDGEEFYYQIYQVALAVNKEGKVVAYGITDGRDMKELMQNKVLPKVIESAKKADEGASAALTATELVAVRRSFAAINARRERQRAQLALAQRSSAQPEVAFPVSGFSGLMFACGLFSALMGVTFAGSRFMNTRTVNVGNPLLGEP